MDHSKQIEIISRGEINSWPVVYVEGTAEPLIEDEVLGKRLGFERPRKIRDLIERMVAAAERARKEGDPPVEAPLRGVARRPAGGGHMYQPYLLTERQALKVVMRSETPTADAIQDQVISVYMAWRAGRLTSRDEGRLDRLDRLEGLVETLIRYTCETRLAVTNLEDQAEPAQLDSSLDKAELKKLWSLIAVNAKGRDLHPNIVAREVLKAIAPTLNTYKALTQSQVERAKGLLVEKAERHLKEVEDAKKKASAKDPDREAQEKLFKKIAKLPQIKAKDLN